MSDRKQKILENVTAALEKKKLSESLAGIAMTAAGALPVAAAMLAARRNTALRVRRNTNVPAYRGSPLQTLTGINPASFKVGLQFGQTRFQTPSDFRQTIMQLQPIVGSIGSRGGRTREQRRALAALTNLNAFRVPATTPITHTGVDPFSQRLGSYVGAAGRLSKGTLGLLARPASPYERRRGLYYRGAIPALGRATVNWGANLGASTLFNAFGILGGAGTRSVGTQGIGIGDASAESGGERYSGAQMYRGG